MKRILLVFAFCLPMAAQTCVLRNGVLCTPQQNMWLWQLSHPTWNVQKNASTNILTTGLANTLRLNLLMPQTMQRPLIANVNTILNVAAPPFNAVSDALSDSTCSIASGSTSLTCIDAPFSVSSCGAGKVISVQFAGGRGGNNQPLVTTCTYVSSRQVTLAAPATQNAFGVVSGFGLSNAGKSGYTTAHNIATTTSGTGAGARVSIATAGGQINGKALLFNGNGGTSGYTTASVVPTTSSCGPTTATANLIASGGVLTAASTVRGVGLNYPLGCQIYPTQGGSSGNAYFTVTSAAVSVDSGGLGYAVGDKIYPTQGGSSGDAYVTVTAVSNTGAIWGTDDTAAFNAWAAALGPGKPGLIPNGQFIYNMGQGKQTMTLASNTSITMNRSGTLFMIGGHPNGPLGGWLFTVPQGAYNVQFDSLNVSGEFINHGNIYNGLGYGGGIDIGSGSGSPTHNIQIKNSIFSNLLSTPAFDSTNTDYNIDFIDNVVQNAGEVNLNSSNTNVVGNHLISTGGIESGGGTNFHVDNNILDNPDGSYAIEVGGATAGAPTTGGTVRGNIIRNPLPGDSCISIGDGFSHGVIDSNICTGLSQSALGGGFGIINVYSGYVPTSYNTISNNQISGYLYNSMVALSGATNDKVQGNSGSGAQTGAVFSNAQGVDSSGNTWTGAFGNDMTLAAGSNAHVNDVLTYGKYTLAGGGAASSFASDSHLYTPSGVDSKVR